jgi:predicted Zn finger-like uncharacterized protein
MRLICPKCNAQYNVADNAIPQGGRDVQCSSCGNTWVQTDKPKVLSREVSRILSTPIPSVVKTQSRDVSGYDMPQSGRGQAEGPMHEPVGDGPRHRQVDPNVANILREEAARAHGVSDYSAGTAAPKRENKSEDIAETRKRIAQFTAGSDDVIAGNSGARSATGTTDPRAVPDINEINAALRARFDESEQGGLTELEKHEAMRRRGFRRGFFVVLILIGLILLPYVFADDITQNMPQLRGYMATYVAIIDQLRLSLNSIVDAVTAGIANLTG